MKDLGKEAVTWLEIDENAVGQRIDNFLMRELKGVPKSHIYRILRSGEVRVNSGRIDATCRLALGDKVRIPPIRVAAKPIDSSPQPVTPVLDKVVLYEDDALLIIDKPSGLAAHGGSGIARGVIEQMRLERPQLKFLELAHRLDRETSGVLMMAKKRSALTKLHDMLRDGEVDKRYLTLVKGVWPDKKRTVKLKLHKYLTEGGERRVSVNEAGKDAHSIFYLRQSFTEYSLLECELKTGRTHQIRVHLAHLGYPIAGDDKYGDFALNKQIAKHGLKRMFLHAFSISLQHPLTGENLRLEAALPSALASFLSTLKHA